MKRFSVVLALFLCVILSVFAFASCGRKSGKTDTTAAPGTTPESTAGTTAAATTPDATTDATDHVHIPGDDYVIDVPATCSAAGSKSYHCVECLGIIPGTEEPIPVIPHTPSDDYVVDVPATCSAAGSKSYHCTECNAIITDSVVVLPLDPDAHNVSTWEITKYNNLFEDGSRHGECLICHADVVETLDQTEPIILDSGAGADAYPVELVTNPSNQRYHQEKNVNDIKGEAHYYPTEESPLGNDLLVEVSFLWNETLTTGMGGTFDFLNRDGYDVVNISMKDGVSGYAPAAGGIAARERSGYVYVYPTPAAIAENPALKYPNIGAYGWHRLGFRVHQEAALVADAVRYTYIVSTYVDGELVLSIDVSAYANNSGNERALLFKAKIEDGELVCYDTDVQNKAYLTLYDFFKQAGSYLVIGDVYMSCGNDFIQQVMKVDSPAQATLEVADGVNVPAPFWFTLRHDHAWDGNFTQTKAATVLEEGAKTEHCTICGAEHEVPVAFVPNVQTWTSSSSGNYSAKKALAEIQGDDHFYPTEDNPEGNDLLIEYSLLWNDTLLNLEPGTNTATSPFITTKIANWNGTEDNVLTYWSPTNNVNDAWCKYAGGFEAGALQLVAEEDIVAGGTPAGMCASGGGFSDYPNVGGADQANPEYGWHRVGIRLHQEVTNVDAVKAGEGAEYRFVITLYFDGVPVSMLKGTTSDAKKIGTNNYLFTASSDGNGGITYADNAKLNGEDSVRRTIFAIRFNAQKAKADTAVYWADADIYYTCGKEFVQKVTKVADPEEATVTLAEGVTRSAKVYYTAAPHEHSWTGAYVVTKAATLIEDGTRYRTCPLCGAVSDEAEPLAYEPIVFDSGVGASAYSSSYVTSNRFQIRNGINVIKGDNHFYPTADAPNGKDVLLEISILWNETLTTGAGPTFDALNMSGNDVVNISMKDGVSGYAPTAGGLAMKERSGYVYVSPTPAEIAEDASVKYANLGEYGWHRFGVRFHQEAAIVEGAVKYTYIVTAYIDGEQVAQIDNSAYANSTPNALLFTASIEDGELVYADASSSGRNFYFTLYDFFNKADSYLVIGDVYMTCGTDFVQQVEKVATPADATLTVAEGVVLPAKMYYKAKD